MDAKEMGLQRISRNTIDFNGVATTVLHTVPEGKSFVPVMIIIHTLSADMNTTVLTAGISTAAAEFRSAVTCSGANGVTKILVLSPNWASTPATGSGLGTIIPADSTFVLDITTGSGGACTGIVDLIGCYI